MKIKSGFVLREAAGSFIIVPTGNARLDFNGMITFNATGALIWRALEEGLDKASTVKRIVDLYAVDEATAENDVEEFYKRLQGAGLLEG